MTDQNTPATSRYAVLPEPVRLEDTIAERGDRSGAGPVHGPRHRDGVHAPQRRLTRLPTSAPSRVPATERADVAQ